MELTINGKTCPFKATFGVIRKINKMEKQKVRGSDREQEVGLRLLIAELIDGDVEALVTAISELQAGEEKLTKAEIEAFLEDENTDIDKVFEKFLDFFSKANLSKKTYQNLMNLVEEQKKKNEEEE